MDSQQAREVAHVFVAARRAATGLDIYPGDAPVDMASAYAIQDFAIHLDGRTIAGWKVGKINPPEDTRLGTDRLAGPIFANTVFDVALGDTPDMPIFADGFGAAEAEFLLHVAPGWDGSVPASNQDVLALLDKAHIGIEIASSPYVGINAGGPPVTVSDFGNNAGLLIGPAIENWQDANFNTITVRLDINGQTMAENTTSNMLDGPLGAVRFLLENLQARAIDGSAGLWVSTGAITGVHPVAPGDTVRAQFLGIGELHCRITAATAT